MKRVVIGIFISMLMFGSVLTSANIVQKEIEFTDGEITVTIDIGNYEIENYGEGFEINVEDFGRYLVAGKPNLPAKIFSIAIPPGSEFVDIEYSTGEGIVLEGNFNVLPCDLPQVIGEEDPLVRAEEEKVYQENYETIYSSDETYPSSNVEFVRTAGYRRYNLVDARVIPFSFKPISGKLTYYPEFTITVSYRYPKGFSSSNIMNDYNIETEKWAENIIYNHNEAKNWYPLTISGKQTNDYVIITLDSLTSAIEPLVEWEEAKGRSVYVATTSWIDTNYNGYDLQEKMRNFLLEKYPTDEWGILDVCLIGDYGDVPMRLCAQNAGYGQPDTDYYYAELSLPDSQSWDADEDHQYGEDNDPIDFYAEVSVGRIPWSDSEIVEDICLKSVAYEQNSDDSFKKNILLLGAYFWADTDNAVLMEYKTNPELHTWMEDWTSTKMYEEGHTTYECDYNLQYDNVKSVWSEGTYAFVNWAGHGSPTSCHIMYSKGSAFVTTDTCPYLNDDYPAIIFADACSNSDTEHDNIGKMMLKQGAVGFLGSTKVAYGMHGWDDPMDGSSQSLDYWFTTCCTSGDYTQGEAHQYALLEMYTNGLWYYERFEAFEWGALWGNPDITMGPVAISDPPETPANPDGPDQGTNDEEYEFFASTTDPDGDQLYYMFDWGDGEYSDWEGPYPSGETGLAIHSWTELGIYDVKVQARDEWGRKSEWSDVTIFPIMENSPPDIPIITGPTTGKIGEPIEITVIATDIDNQYLYYSIFWGTGGGDFGPFPSGEEQVFEYTWTKSGQFTIKITARDTKDTWGECGEFDIKIGRSRSIEFQLLESMFQRFPNIFPMFRYLLGL